MTTQAAGEHLRSMSARRRCSRSASAFRSDSSRSRSRSVCPVTEPDGEPGEEPRDAVWLAALVSTCAQAACQQKYQQSECIGADSLRSKSMSVWPVTELGGEPSEEPREPIWLTASVNTCAQAACQQVHQLRAV